MAETFGQRLKRLREAQGLSQNKFCERAGISSSTYYKMETDTRGCTAYTLDLLATTLNVSMDYLWRGEEGK